MKHHRLSTFSTFYTFSALFLLLALQPFSPLALSQPRPKILGISHAALLFAPAHLDAELAFYTDYLGYEKAIERKNPDGSLKFIGVKINDLQQIELFPAKATDPDADRLHQIALITDDCEAMRQYLASKNWKVPARPAAPDALGNLTFAVKDPDGHTIEFVEYGGAGWTLATKGQHLPPTRVAPRILHVGIKVADYAAALHFYGDILGCKEFWRGSKDEKFLSYVNMRLPGTDEYIEFILYGGPEPKTANQRSMNHICLESTDVPAAWKTLQTRRLPPGCKAPPEAKVSPNSHQRLFSTFDPEGTRVELMERATVDGKPAPSSTAPIPTPDKLKTRAPSTN